MKILLGFIILSVSSLLYGQVNIEKFNDLNRAKGFEGNISFYISAKTGNTDIQEFEMDVRLNYAGSDFYTFLIGNGEYGWNKGIEFSNSALLHFRYIQKLNQIFNPEFFAQINYNKSRLLLFRSLVGIGLRTTLISDSTTSLNFGTAYMYEYEDLDLPVSAIHNKNTNHHIWSNYISYSSSLANSSRLSIVIYAQPRFNKFSDIRLLSENHVKVGISDKLSLSVNFGLRYDSKPPDGVKDLDTNTKFGLTIKL